MEMLSRYIDLIQCCTIWFQNIFVIVVILNMLYIDLHDLK